jgi:MFS family permease
LTKHNLFTTLRRLRGNARGCVYTEPLWGIPFNLYAPYVSVYMLALGLTDSQVGLISSVGLAFQVVWSLLSGAIADKLGRKRTTLIFDIVSWSIPTLIWAVAQNFTYFLVAAVVNSVWRVTQNSWTLILVEDTDPDLLVDIYAWVHIAGLVAAFVTPLTGLLVGEFGLVPTMRGLYVLAFVMMTAKFFSMNALVTETERGKIRREETCDQSLFAVLSESPVVFRQILRSPATLYVGALMILLEISWLVRGTFWSILATQRLQIPDEQLALYTFVRSMTMLLFFFIVTPKLRQMKDQTPMMLGLAGLIVSHILLVTIPPGNRWLLLMVTFIEGCSIPMTTTLLGKMVAVTVDPDERARIMALLNVAVLLVTSPFGWIAGRLSTLDRRWPFVLTAGCLLLAGALVVQVTQTRKRQEACQSVSAQAELL